MNAGTELNLPHEVRIAGRSFPFTSLEQVSAAYSATIHRLGVGGSETPRCEIFDGSGQRVARVSYNGRVWNNDDFCLYDPIINPTFPARMAPEGTISARVGA